MSKSNIDSGGGGSGGNGRGRKHTLLIRYIVDTAVLGVMTVVSLMVVLVVVGQRCRKCH